MNKLSESSKQRIKKLLFYAGLALAVILLAGALGRRSGSVGEKGSNNQQRLAYIQSLGWEAEEDAKEEKEVLLPEEFPEVLQNYNQMQQEAGFDLTKYAGKKIELYVYKLENYPSEAEVLCTLYVYRGRIIGGDIHSTAFRGFMKPLHKCEDTAGKAIN